VGVATFHRLGVSSSAGRLQSAPHCGPATVRFFDTYQTVGVPSQTPLGRRRVAVHKSSALNGSGLVTSLPTRTNTGLLFPLSQPATNGRVLFLCNRDALGAVLMGLRCRRAPPSSTHPPTRAHQPASSCAVIRSGGFTLHQRKSDQAQKTAPSEQQRQTSLTVSPNRDTARLDD
jgi:hypothetical protein